MATLGRGFTFGATEQVTNSKLHSLVDSGTCTGIVNADVDSSAAIANSKLNLSSISQAITATGGLTITTNPITMTSEPINQAEGANISSAGGTPAIGAATGNSVHITGTTTITAFDTIQAGTLRNLIFDGALTLTHNGTSLILPTGANITTAAGDTALMMSEGSGNWRCLAYNLKSGSPLVAATASTALSGSVIQVVNTQTGSVATGSTALPADNTIPQNTEGDQFMTLAITPNNSSNSLLIEVVVQGSPSAQNEFTIALFQDTTSGALAVGWGGCAAPGVAGSGKLIYKMTAGTTSATTFKVRCGGASGTFTFNGVGGVGYYGGVLASSITIQEIKA